MLSTNGYQNFLSQAADCQAAFPGLHLQIDGEVPALSGTIALQDEQGNTLDTYQISIQASSDFPMSFPLVFETAGQIPRNYDWHVYETDGHCCLKTLPEEIIACRKGMTLRSFVQDEVFPYFFSQTFRRINGYFLQERAHSNRGWLEYFQEVFRTANDQLIVQGLTLLARGQRPSRTEDCFCGSGQKFRKCHRNSLDELSLLQPEEIRQILSRLRPG